MAQVNALLGGVLLTSDDPAGYSPTAREQYRALRELSRAENIHVDTNRGLCVTYTIGGQGIPAQSGITVPVRTVHHITPSCLR